MFDNDAVIADMQKIFSRAAPDAPVVTPVIEAPAVTDQTPAISSPKPPRTSFLSRIDGVATIGFAAFVALAGIIAVPLLQEPAPSTSAAPVPDLSTPAPAFAIDPAITPPPAGSLPAAIVTESVARSAIRPVHRPRRLNYAHRPYRIHRPHIARSEAPHLRGEALRKALAEDAVITRHLNQEALRKLPTPSDRRGNS